MGADGCTYVSDFYDQRTAHPDPDANWDRTNGRIYRLEPASRAPRIQCDLAKLSSNELVDLLLHENRWFADRARVELSTRRDSSVAPRLKEMATQTEDPNQALQGLWAFNACAELDDVLAIELLDHPVPYVRFWTVRLLGDRKTVSSGVMKALVDLVKQEDSPVVLAQMAASAKRLPHTQGLALVEELLNRQAGRDDPRVPWLIWWAIEAHATTDTAKLIEMFSPAASWSNEMRRENGFRLLRRWAADGTHRCYSACNDLLKSALAEHETAALEAVRQGLSERSQGFEEITQGGLFDQHAQETSTEVQRGRRVFEPVNGRLRTTLLELWHKNPADVLSLELALRVSSKEAYDALCRQLASTSHRDKQLGLLRLLREFAQSDAIPLALRLVSAETPEEVLSAALDVLARFDDPHITDQLLQEYPALPENSRLAVRDVLFARPGPGLAFLQRVDRGEFSPQEIPVQQLRHIANHHSSEIDALVRKHWGNLGPGSTEERLATMRRLSNDLRAAAGHPEAGKVVFKKHCATCHQLHGEGENIGPDLTIANRQDQAALLANIVDPSAVIRREYIAHIAVTTSGRVVTGLIAEQDAASISLITPESKRVKLSREEIDEINESDISQMPERILEALSPQELRDLFSYLQK
jgi:putative heme-binding domain-containing protein